MKEYKTDDSEILLFFCGQHWEEIRHTETQRAALTNLIILIASGIFGLLLQKGLSRAFIPLAGLLIFLGLYGAITTYKLYERYRYLQNRLQHWYDHINELHPNAEIISLRRKADEEHRKRFPVFEKRVHVHQLWMLLHLVMCVSGITLLIVILVYYF